MDAHESNVGHGGRAALWIWAQYAFWALMVVVLLANVPLGWALPLTVGVFVVSFIAFSYVIRPQRSWWGREVVAASQDQTWIRDHRKRLLRTVLIAVALGVPVVVLLVPESGTATYTGLALATTFAAAVVIAVSARWSRR